MKDEKMIEMFDSIPKFDTYSKYSQTLQRVFKHNSLTHLIQELKSPKQFQYQEFLDEFNSKHPYEQEKNFNDKVLDINTFSNIKNSKKEGLWADDTPPQQPSLSSTQLQNQKTQIKEQDSKQRVYSWEVSTTPDPCKYNPNYSAIYPEVPKVQMAMPKHHRRKVVPPICNKSVKLPMLTEAFDDDNKKYNKKALAPLKARIKTEGNANEQRKSSNHALRFSQYTNRKSFNSDSFCKLDKVSYLEPFNYLTGVHGVPDFKKMSQRNQLDMLNKASNNTPSICYYQPKFDAVEKKSPKISFSTRQKKIWNKQYLMKKIWNSYKVTAGYQLVSLDDEEKKPNSLANKENVLPIMKEEDDKEE